ncbi:hypothetical protein [Wenyingzhuangia marina]|uniref:Uncharacterized protein n=1 Tax=Wenyingzhuangia marina TaxID=1195760 RepID=A0A1M5V8R6_9FLAO|nr:hypothetical protein [Wenyingzhuangia marina]GGF73737.1 hypothetical protein GCM10011397_15820 [Wenyingzhuangia marina]SHH71484.1 hypothetical protein SAMN05444281_1597 [Wenyingzhuangia marina]
MNKYITFLITGISVILSSCNPTGKKSILEEGYYQLTTSTTDSKTISSLSFVSGTLHVINQDSLEFIGYKSIGETLFGYNHFNYKINNNIITLYNNSFKESFPLNISNNKDITLEINRNKFKTLFFERLKLKLNLEKYVVVSFTKQQNTDNKEIEPYINHFFNHAVFEFISKDSVIVSPKMIQYMLKDSVNVNPKFQYKITNQEIIFNNTKHKFTIPYTYDGVIHLNLNDETFVKLDLIEKY